MAVSISIAITQNSQNIANNTSNVTVKVTAKWTNGSYNAVVNASGTPQAKGWLKIDGTSYDFASTFNTKRTSSGSQTIFTKTVNVSHTNDGSKTLACSASYSTYVSSGTVTASASKTLTTIPRKSTLSVTSGTLGDSQALSIVEMSSSFKHKLKYTCGDVSGWILGGESSFSTSNSVLWKPPLSLAQQNTTGTSVSVTFTLYTYTDDGTSVGSNAYTKTFSIPASVKPSVSVGVSDDTGYADTFGGYVQNFSKLKIVVTALGSYGSTIKSYRTEADGKTYTAANITTDVIAGTGTLTIRVTVTDSRGRTNTATATVSVLAYTAPKIGSFSAYRCDADGKASSSGSYMALLFDATITPLNNKNAAKYTVEYKKTTESEYNAPVTLTDYTGQYSVSGGLFVLAAETSSSYNITFTASDSFGGVPKTAVVSSVGKLWSLLKKAGKVVGISFGKIAEFEGVLEIAFQTKFTGGILQPVLEAETDFDDIIIPNTYTLKNCNSAAYSNCPLSTGTGTLTIETCGEEGQLRQIVTVCHKTSPLRYERFYYGGAWGEWVCVSGFVEGGTLLWSGGYYMTAAHTAPLSDPVSAQRNGIVLVFSEYHGGLARTYHHTAFIPKTLVAKHPGEAHCFQMSTPNLEYFAVKLLLIKDDEILGADSNGSEGTGNCGIKYTNNRFVLRYVIGV